MSKGLGVVGSLVGCDEGNEVGADVGSCDGSDVGVNGVG